MSECNADLDHPCDADQTDDGESRACISCRQTLQYWQAQYEINKPQRQSCLGCGQKRLCDVSGCCSQACLNQSLQDAGRA